MVNILSDSESLQKEPEDAEEGREEEGPRAEEAAAEAIEMVNMVEAVAGLETVEADLEIEYQNEQVLIPQPPFPMLGYAHIRGLCDCTNGLNYQLCPYGRMSNLFAQHVDRSYYNY